MPVQLFTEAERTRRDRFPEAIAYEDLVIFFTLSEGDRGSLPRHSAPHNRLGYALQLCTLRFMGFVPNDLSSVPPEAVAFVTQQLGVKPDVLADYGTRAQTRQDHLQAVQAHLGYYRAKSKDLKALASWLLERADEELFEAVDKLAATVFAVMVLFAGVNVTIFLVHGGLTPRADVSDHHGLLLTSTGWVSVFVNSSTESSGKYYLDITTLLDAGVVFESLGKTISTMSWLP